MDYKGCSSYELIDENKIKVLESEGYLLRHKKTGARVVLLKNDDENKVFYIGFRTPPCDSTGVMHILEHSVLCGSKNFPVKDPFIELAKGSLNTFLNAMTFPDKTVYPVASCNDMDFQNLMHVYLDAVFYPNILNSDKTFRQEGWHYELEDRNDDIAINGVVYSEMKGAFSNPDEVLSRYIFNSLFPDTPYGEESGGDPRVIPELTYEHYLETYRKYYHPSNSYIFLYGDVDMDAKLDFIDREYLSHFDALDVDSSIPYQKPFAEKVSITKEYSVGESESLENNSYLSINYAMKDNLDPEGYLAWKVIDYALGSSSGAVLKQALIDKGIGDEVFTQYDNGVCQPYFSVVAKGTDIERRDEFVSTVNDVLSDVVKNGFDKDTLRAGLNLIEFSTREADFGHYPAGLIYGLTILDSWLYDDGKPFIHIDDEQTFRSVREKIDTDYFERLVEDLLINNTHCSEVHVVPSREIAAAEEKRLSDKLAAYKASLSEEELDDLIEATRSLIAYQEEKDDPEALKCIPLLGIDDIKKETSNLQNVVDKVEDSVCLYHDINTRGIDYARIIFSIDNIPERLYPYVGLLQNVLALMSTENYSYQELFNKIFIETGGISNAINLYSQKDGSVKVTVDWKGKCLKGDIGNVFSLWQEIITRTLLDDTKRLLELIKEAISRTQTSMISSGHVVASGCAVSNFSKYQKTAEILKGMDQYRFLEEIDKNFDSVKEELVNTLKETSTYVFNRNNVMFDFAGSREEYEVFKKEAEAFLGVLPDTAPSIEHYEVDCNSSNIGYTCASQIQYVAMAGNYKKAGLEYTGSLRVLKTILGYGYLWNEVRVKGGAYGCMSSFSSDGDSYLVSYRDPNLSETIDVFKNTIEYLKNYEASDREMVQNIIGAVSVLDTPLNPSAKAVRGLASYMTGRDESDYQKERDEVLATDAGTIRELYRYLEAIIDYNSLCVIGNEEKIRDNSDLFDEVKALINS